MVNGFHTPILLNVFNRPQETSSVLNVLQDLAPQSLYVHCDGPRANNEADTSSVQEVRKMIREKVVWPCDLHLSFEERNLGCGQGPAASMNWFFSEVDEGIILEDDCVPNMDFFMYCQELLERYRNDTRIGVISGTCFCDIADHTFSYHYSAYAGIWGWATWKRTWDLFDYSFSMSDREFTEKVLPFIKSKSAVSYWLNILHRCINDGDDRSYWDYQLHLSMLCANKIHILPNCNLVSNIGFNDSATHTFDSGSKYANASTERILPLIHPTRVSINHNKDNRPYSLPPIKKLKRILKRFLQYGKR